MKQKYVYVNILFSWYLFQIRLT